MIGDQASIVYVYHHLEEAKQDELVKKETGQINIEWFYNAYMLGLLYSKPGPAVGQWQGNLNLYLAYIYAIISISQGVLTKTLLRLKNDKYLQDLKTAKMLSNDDIAHWAKEIRYCQARFEIYDTIMKQMFGIPYKETSFQKIGQYFPTYNNLTKEQLENIQKKIVDPLFHGKFHNIYPSPLIAIACSMDTNGSKHDCKLYSLPSFPFPELNEGTTSPDCVRPFVIYNEIAHTARISFDTMSNVSLIHRLLAFMTLQSVPEYLGSSKQAANFIDWIKEKANDAGEAAADVAGAAAALGGELYNLGKSAVGAASSVYQKSSYIGPILIVGAVGAVGIFLLTDSNKK